MLPNQAVRPLADKIAILHVARHSLIASHDAIARAMSAPTIVAEAPSDSACVDGGRVATWIAEAHREAVAAVEMLARIVVPPPASVDGAIGGGR